MLDNNYFDFNECLMEILNVFTLQDYFKDCSSPHTDTDVE